MKTMTSHYRSKNVFKWCFYLQVTHPLLQASVSNPCVSKRCSHLCVLAPGLKSVCKCPSQFLLDKDGHTCSTSKDSSFILFLSHHAITQVDGL